MSQIIIAKRYAKALFEAAQEKGLLEQVEREWEQVVQVFDEHQELQKWFAYPKTSTEQKKEMVAKLFPDLSDLSRNLLELLTERRRESVIHQIGKEYRHLSLEARGIAEAEVITPSPLSDKEEKELIAVFQKRIGKTLQVTNRVDSDVLGGVIVRIGDRLYDGSLKNKLARFQKSLAESRIG